MNKSQFYTSHLAGLHSQLLSHPLTREHLQGHFRLDGVNSTPGMVIELPFAELEAADFAQLFVVFDGSRVHQQREEPHKAPEGVYFTTVNGRLLQYKSKIGVVFLEGEGAGLHMPFLYFDQFFLSGHIAPLLGTISFALSAIAAHCCGLAFIELIAAGGVGFHRKHIGYRYWPKVGFDAALIAGEASHMNGAQTVQDVLAIDPVWWDENGSQRLMRFDLAAQSTSWWKLLSYCQEKQIFVP